MPTYNATNIERPSQSIQIVPKLPAPSVLIPGSPTTDSSPGDRPLTGLGWQVPSR